MIPEGFKIIEYLNGVVFDHSIDYVINSLTQHNAKHCCDYDNIQIVNNWSQSGDSVQMVMIGQPKPPKKV